jgi:hypothetical protein
MIYLAARHRIALLTGIVALAGFTVTALSPGASAQPRAAVTAKGCLGDLGRAVGTPATVVSGAAAPSVTAEFSVLNRAPTSTDAVPVSGLGGELQPYPVASVDLSASRLLRVIKDQDGPYYVYLVPVTLRDVSVPAACGHFTALAGIDSLLALLKEEVGSGPGVCAVETTGDTPDGGLTVNTGQICSSTSVLEQYGGQLGTQFADGDQYDSVIPDGVSSLRATYANGTTKTFPVLDNFAQSPSPAYLPDPFSKSLATKELNRALATSVEELGLAGQTVRTLRRPPDLIDLAYADARFMLNAKQNVDG